MVPAPGSTGLVQVLDFGPNPSNTSMYIYVPAQLAARPAIVVAIHYCTGTAQAYYAQTIKQRCGVFGCDPSL